MKAIPDALRAGLAGPATTLAWCWRLTRTDGTVLGFTDHDEALVVQGLRCEAASGLSASEAEAELGLAATTQEVEGALSSLSLDEADIRAGRYDGATVETFLVDWTQPEVPLLVAAAEIGEVRRSAGAFTGELRGLAAKLDQRHGRIYQRRCDAVLGDGRCRVDLTAPAHRAQVATVRGEAGGTVLVSGLDPARRPLFRQGTATWLDGAGRGVVAEIVDLQEGSATGDTRLVLRAMPEIPIGAGERLQLTAGCDKSFATCRMRFDNGLNFRGFPHLPGSDAALGIAKTDGLHDGSPVVP
ncbi:DUF2163 domain-containing protein [Mangrovibrevibacter kandeliae]|uniref:DUF2163 domain-containing protein n=1 Tax=Mangrovibrevibacter kandeliae TaxID=2968473 RepID=UPI00211808EB|nr:DUF2163 domain-containing protein [Aurantimonas sp. CSK15Z-1]MCQ8781088.1 DUF2163 domain-containing protein [Aurantimonas sp. CSK15Z-1]